MDGNDSFEEIREKLSKQEKKILLFIVDEFSNKEIGSKLFISYRTVKKHKSNIAIKLKIPGRDLGRAIRKVLK